MVNFNICSGSPQRTLAIYKTEKSLLPACSGISPRTEQGIFKLALAAGLKFVHRQSRSAGKRAVAGAARTECKRLCRPGHRRRQQGAAVLHAARSCPQMAFSAQDGIAQRHPPIGRDRSSPAPPGRRRAAREMPARVHSSKCRHMTATRGTRRNRESSANRTEACGLIYP